MINSRRKGATFERAIATDLRVWLGPDWKVARLRTDEQQGDQHAGEFAISGGPFRFPFAIECKAHKAFSGVQLWKDPPTGPLPSWWAQAVRQAEGAGLLPMLLVRYPGGPVLCCLRMATAARLSLGHDCPQQRLWLDDGSHGGESLWLGRWAALLELDPYWLAEVV